MFDRYPESELVVFLTVGLLIVFFGNLIKVIYEDFFTKKKDKWGT